MNYDRSIIALSPHVTTTIIDAIQRAIIDKGACRATRKAAFSALLALADAGLMEESRSTNWPARSKTHIAEWLLAGPRG
ncbi:MAG: hypothetical protein J2P48_20650 [Alphaproteobacteria bacterium]|nr:hypothetical protein [Alphaproteobacteria bacterium]MBO0758992.1 hypothetical protein [Bradyrhizobiaceae bacterium]